MSGHKPFAALRALDEQNYFVKALYFAYGHNAQARKVNAGRHAFTLPIIDAINFAECYMRHVANGDGHVINVDDCLEMYLNGETEFKR